MTEFKTKSAKETVTVGKKIASYLKKGTVLALSGDLGAGKTTLVKGVVQGLGGKAGDAASPTFVLIHEYKAPMKIFHIDLYRIDKLNETDALYIEECLTDDAITLIEWPERAKDILPKNALRVEIKHAGDDNRIIRFFKK